MGDIVIRLKELGNYDSKMVEAYDTIITLKDNYLKTSFDFYSTEEDTELGIDITVHRKGTSIYKKESIIYTGISFLEKKDRWQVIVESTDRLLTQYFEAEDEEAAYNYFNQIHKWLYNE